ncbi:MAG: ATP-binding protein [Thermodesulfobacteriota bacterium]|nr:ATP-binding protein [Thermodesulfobacteriota bacterium]
MTTLEDIVGLEHTRLLFFGELNKKIIELQAANMELEQKRLKIQAILDSITDVMAVVSADFRILSVNHIFFNIFQFKDPQGFFCYEIFRKKDAICRDCPLITARQNNYICRRQLAMPVHGKTCQFEITVSPLHKIDGRKDDFLLLMRDITKEKEYEANYLYSEKMATIGVLASGVAHEINNPLTAVSGFSEGLKRRIPRLEKLLKDSGNDDLIEDFKEYTETILNECNRCRDIVKSLLTFSPRRKAEFSLIDLGELLADVLKLIHYRLKLFKIDPLQLELDNSCLNVMGIAAELKQVMINLLFNAFDAIAEGDTITIATKRENEWIVFSVKDTGQGIPDKDLDKIFDPFFTTKALGKGTGIGLAACYNIIKQHNGDITVETRKNIGTTFYMKLPCLDKKI